MIDVCPSRLSCSVWMDPLSAEPRPQSLEKLPSSPPQEGSLGDTQATRSAAPGTGYAGLHLTQAIPDGENVARRCRCIRSFSRDEPAGHQR